MNTGVADDGSAAIAGPVFVTIANRKGLHARASAKFVNLASTFDAEVSVGHDGAIVSGTSILDLMMLAASIGETIEISATGPQAAAAIAELSGLVLGKFGED